MTQYSQRKNNFLNFFFVGTKVAGNTDGYVHSLMLAVEKQKSIVGGSSGGGRSSKNAGIDLNQFNIQYGAELDEQQLSNSSFISS